MVSISCILLKLSAYLWRILGMIYSHPSRYDIWGEVADFSLPPPNMAELSTLGKRKLEIRLFLVADCTCKFANGIISW